MYDNKNTKGYVALITTLVVGSLAMSITVGMLSIGITQTQTAGVKYDAVRAGALADACVEYALQEIRNNTNFNGNGTETFSIGSCTYDVILGGGESRTIESTGAVNNAIRRVAVTLDQITPDLNITRWVYVDSF